MAVRNDDHGIADDSRPGQQPEASPDARRIDKADDVGTAAETGDKSVAVDGGREEEGLELEAAIRDISSISTEWVGPLPIPGSLGQFDRNAYIRARRPTDRSHPLCQAALFLRHVRQGDSRIQRRKKKKSNRPGNNPEKITDFFAMRRKARYSVIHQ